MNYRAELVRLITNGAQSSQIADFFVRHDFHPLEVDAFLHDAGVYLHQRPKHHDGISDKRRRELQELSTSED